MNLGHCERISHTNYVFWLVHSATGKLKAAEFIRRCFSLYLFTRRRNCLRRQLSFCSRFRASWTGMKPKFQSDLEVKWAIEHHHALIGMSDITT
jgi:hypothetical protein